MKHTILIGLAIVAAAAAVFQLCGCSVIGLMIGAVSDASKPNQLTIPGWQVQTVKPGAWINITLTGGERLSGKYSGLARLRAE